MNQYQQLSKVDQQGYDFSCRTAFMIAYQRMLQSQLPQKIRLFNDPLAQYFTHGEIGKRVSDLLAYCLKPVFDPNGEIGLIYQGHINYTAARTSLITDLLYQRIKKSQSKFQVLNLGAGVDTRSFWTQCLKKAQYYIQVDKKPINDYKQKTLKDLKQKGLLMQSKCKRKVISLDFSNQSLKDLPNYGFQIDIQTVWILEGLVMYLKKEQNEKLLQQLSDLSQKGSYVIINIADKSPNCSIQYIDSIMTKKGWTKQYQLMFGQKRFNYGKYPADKPANKNMGFITFTK